MYNPEQIDKIKKWLGEGSINIFGRPFAGKDIQGQRLADLFNGNMIGGGEILRGSNMPDHIKQYMRTGKLIPKDEYISIVLPYFNQDNFVNKPLFMSSVGRWHGEEEGVIGAVQESGHPLKAVIYLDISNSESFSRWQKREINNDRLNRHDDTEEILNVRFSEFLEKTIPVIDYYSGLGILIKIDGTRSRDEVTSDILESLSKLADNI